MCQFQSKFVYFETEYVCTCAYVTMGENYVHILEFGLMCVFACVKMIINVKIVINRGWVLFVFCNSVR
jgi:hypothetical protein